MNRSRLRSILLVALMLVALASMYSAGKAQSLDTAVPERFRYYGIPIAVSDSRYGLSGYVAYAEIAARFFNDKSIEVILSEDLPQALDDRTIKNGRRGEGLFFVPADDKGDVTFARMAFRLFGPHVRSLYRMYFALLLLSVGAFVVAFRADLFRLLVGVCVLLASLALVSAYQEDLLLPNVVTFYDPRIYGVIAVLAVFHLGFVCLDRQQPSPVRLLCAAYQALMIVLAVHIRSDNVLLVGALTAWVAADGIWKVRTRQQRGFLRHIWALMVLAAAFAGLLAWERVAYNPRYFSTHMAHHLVWHNVGIGLALQPDFAKEFDYPPAAARRVDQEGDVAMMKTVARSLLASGHPDTVDKIFGVAYSNPAADRSISIDVGKFFHTSSSDLALYDSKVKDFVLTTAGAHPWQTVELFVWYKPRYILAHYLWFTGLTGSKPTIDVAGYPSPLFSGTDTTPRDSRVAFAPIPWLAILILGLALLVAPPLAPERLGGALAGSAMLLAFSVVPMMITYAAPFLMGMSLLALSLGLQLSIAVAVLMTGRSRVQLLVQTGLTRAEGGIDAAVSAAVGGTDATLARLVANARAGVVRARHHALDGAVALSLSCITVACVLYFAPRGFNSGFVDMAHDGYQLRQALDLSLGKALFRETFEQYGPLTPYLNLVGFLALGRRLLAIKYFIALWYAVTTLSVYALARQFLGRALSVGSVIVWLAVAPFYQHGVMISPHAYALLFQAVAMVLVLRHPRDAWKPGRLVAVGLLCGVCSLLKQSLGLLFLSAILMFFFAQSSFDWASQRRALGRAGQVAAGFAIVIVAATAWLIHGGALHDWYLQTIAFPNNFYLVRTAAGKSGFASALDLAGRFVTLQWEADTFWLILRTIVIIGAGLAVAQPGRRDWKLILAGLVTLLLWLAAFPSANYMHQWWTISLTISAAVYTLQILVGHLLDRFGPRVRFAADALTMAIVVLLAWPLASARWADARARTSVLTDTIESPWSVSGIRIDSATHTSLTELYAQMIEYRKHHPGTQIVSIDRADGDTQGIAETLPLLSFFDDNAHPFPIYWNLPVLSSVIYPDYQRDLQAFVRQSSPLVLDYLIAGWPDRPDPEGYHLLSSVPTREGHLLLYAPDPWADESEAVALRAIPRVREVIDRYTDEPHRAEVYAWPPEVSPSESLAYQPIDVTTVAARAPIVLGNNGQWVVNGVPETRDSYLLQFKPRSVRTGAQFVATGVLEEGGFTVGFLKNGAWSGFVNITTPGWFAAVLQVPEDGDYELILANLVTAPQETAWQRTVRRLGFGFTLPESALRNRFRIQRSGWVAPPAELRHTP